MRDRGVILAGMAVFLGVATFPIWHNLAGGRDPAMPQLKLPAHERECVAPIPYMKTAHMKLLNEWRDQAIRSGRRSYTAFDGRTFKISLTGTCLEQCHDDKAAFCDRCHTYNGVRTPYCWDCHLDPRQVQQPSNPDSTPQTEAPNGLR